MRTLILVDNSQSIPEKNHADIQEILRGIISNSKENEQIKIGTFAREAAYLCDYTSDHAVLENIIDHITYNDQDTYLSDVLYSAISGLKAESNFVCTRIIIISDGADDNYIGYTNDEVRRFIEDSQYPVYTIGILAKNNASRLETMFSFSRAAEAGYFLMDGSIANEDVVNTLMADQTGVCMKIAPDNRLKDGSSKSILIKLNIAEGGLELKTAVEMPFGTPEPEAKPTELETAPKTELEPAPLPTIVSMSNSDNASGSNEKNNSSQNFLWVFILLAAVAVLAIIVVLVIVKKKTNEEPKPQPKEASEPKPNNGDENKTILVGVQSPYVEPEKELWGKKQLLLKNLNKPEISYKVSIEDVVSIGRSSTQDIVIDDEEVSRSHCKIILRGKLMYLVSCNHANGTYYNNMFAAEGKEVAIVNGGKIKMGKYEYSVELTDD